MKCVKNGAEIKRVKDEEAFKMVKKGWSFCPKIEWGKKDQKVPQIKDAVKEVSPVDAEKKESEKKAKKVYASKKSIREEKKAKKEGK